MSFRMKFVSIILCLSIFNSILASDHNVPVLIYSKTNLLTTNENTVGQSLSSSYFQTLLDKIIPKTSSKVAIILLNKLSDQDVRSNAKNLNKQNSLVYKPSVSQAYLTLTDYLNAEMIKIDLYQADSLEDAFEIFSRKQDDKSFDSVVLTGYKSILDEHHLTKRAGFMIKSSNGSYINNTCGVQFDSILFGTKKTMNMANINSISFDCSLNSSINTFNIQLSENKTDTNEQLTSIAMVFSTKGSYWILSNQSSATSNKGIKYSIRYTGLPDNMETPIKYSFACTSTQFNIVSVNNTYKLVIVKLQIQSFGTTGKIWGQINYCNGFFSNGIWMAITSSLIMLIILAFGISMLTSIQTMSKFDDPKGKALQISAEK